MAVVFTQIHTIIRSININNTDTKMSALKKLPQLKLVLSSPNHQYYRHIMLGEESLCFIEDMNAFYQSLGYSDDVAKAGVLPEEFVWLEYIHNAGYSVCLQMHIINYLQSHSPAFAEAYRKEYVEFVEEHNKARLARGSACAGCKLSEYCKDAQ